MIVYVKGILADITAESAVVDVGGIGYEVLMPARHLNQLPPIGADVKIYTYMQVKEDDQKLFGFLDKEDLAVYKKVIAVSGVGPKSALSILSHLSASELHFAVVSGDAKVIAKAQGIGRKTAEKIVLELKDQFDSDDLLAAVGMSGTQVTAGAPSDEMSEAIEALVALGYSASDALKAVRGIEGAQEMDVEELIRQALAQFM